MNLSVLFVDDEPNILQGLKRMLRGMRQEWDMNFAEDPLMALGMIGSGHYDVIVSDMRMPKMDGGELLTEVQKNHPHMARIILSGQSDKEMVLKTVQVAHRFLSKPCETKKLISTIKSACSIREFLSEEQLRGFMGQMESLPSLSSTYVRLVDMLKNPDASIQKISDIISMDMGMTSKLLKIINSAFFGIGRNISDPAHAVKLLGLEAIRALALTVEIFAVFKDAGSSGLNLEALLAHSLKVANLAKNIALLEGEAEKVADESFFAGMLHDAGKLILATYNAESYRKVIENVTTRQISYTLAEKEITITTHAEAGAYLFCLWGLPDNLVNAVAFHHNPFYSKNPKSWALVTTVFSDAIIKAIENDIPPKDYCTTELKDYMDFLEGADKIQSWEKLAIDIFNNEVNHEK